MAFTNLNENDKQFEAEYQKQRERSEKAILILSLLFTLHTIISYFLICYNYKDDYFINSASTKFYSFVYIENIAFGSLIVFLFNRYKY